MCADTTLRDYKDTLNLPQTDFPMRAGLPKREPDWLARWERIGVYDRLRDQTGRPPFTLHDGPPYANGHLHIGHALNKTIKDIVVRSHQMMGHDARYVPGWDCHGLPIEWKIEEQYRAKGQDKDKVDVLEFRRECRDFAAGWIDVQREEFRRLGVTGAWDRPYLTMDFHAERVIAEEFQKLLMSGLLYRGSKPVMWSPIEKTALAEAEVEYHDKDSFTIWVKFRVAEMDLSGAQMSDEELADDEREAIAQAQQETRETFEGAHVVIWTTTPWTIPSNRGVTFGAEINYGLYEVVETPEECWAEPGERYILADKLAQETFARARLKDGQWRRVRDVTHIQLGAMRLAHPLAGAEGGQGEWDELRDFRAAPFVTDEEGTGFVHCAPSHGMEEFELYRELGMLPQVITYNVEEDGSFRADLPFFGGTRIVRENGKEGDANAAVIDKLVEVGGLLARGRITHSYPHSWRSKAPLIYRNTPQWFAAIDRPVGDGKDAYGTTIRERALTSIEELVSWTPKTGQNRLRAMIETRPDWVLSRQRAWGVPLTCFVRKGSGPEDSDFLLRDPAVNARILEAFETEGSDAWYAEGAKARFLGPDHDADEWEQVFDILDVWFDSGSTHAFVLRDREDGSADGIADVYLEGTDQHRGWFHSSLLQACGTLGRAPYRNVVTHGFTLDAKGNKMSKSLGNTVAPQKVVDQYGADILRLWVAQSDYTGDLRIGDEILKGAADSYRRLRNTLRFILGNLREDGADVAEADMPDLERWVLHRLWELDAHVRARYRAFDIQEVVQAVFNFATVDLSSVYFDIRKDALYCDPPDSTRRRSAEIVLGLLHERLVTWLAPILPFTMEEAWLERYPGEDSSVHLVDMPQTPPEWCDDELAALWAEARAVRRVVTAALEVERREKVIGSSLEAAPIVHLEDAALAEALQRLDFADVCITSGVETVTDPAPPDAFRFPEIDGVAVVFAKAHGQKCHRCWKVLSDVGVHEHADLCGRCNAALE